LRLLDRLTLALRGWEKIENIPTDTFNRIVEAHIAAGWQKQYVYDGFDAWIDYGRVDLTRGGKTLRFEWTNWTEGEVAGPRMVVSEIARTYGLSVRR
jgi:YD repeat-containing protein